MTTTPFQKKRINLSQTSLLKKSLRGRKLHTVCESALCPNIAECFNKNTATFLICGDVCTRDCGFCAVSHGAPARLDEAEPARVAEAASSMGLSYVVITSVTRDDLADGGACHFASTVARIREKSRSARIETLVPDFQGKHEPARTVFLSKPDVFSHNIETVPSLYSKARLGSDYVRSLRLLERASAAGLTVKSGLMLGLGETEEEIISVMKDLQNRGVAILTIGQYLSPSKENLRVERFYTEQEFSGFKTSALAMGFKSCASGPYVRSSYLAEEMLSI